MSDVFILGAGFSKAIHSKMPIMDELSTEVINRLRKLDFPVPPALEKLGNNIELWMTYLSQRQPWLKNHNNDYNQAVTGYIRQQIKEIIDERTSIATLSEAPQGLNCLIKSWHKQCATIITLNYDTLIERASRELQITDDIKRIRAEQMYPPYFSNIASRSGVGLWGGTKTSTFSYLKLHGSVNWFYSGKDNFYGETIFYSDVPPLGEDLLEMERSLCLRAKDKEALIIPPVTEKSAYFDNETVRSLWQEAGSALQDATRVFIIGYSLPITDLGMRFFLVGNQPKPKTYVYIIDINSEVVTQFSELLPNLDIRDEFVSEQKAVNSFFRSYPNILD